MNERLATTFDYLSTTENEAAVRVLTAAMESRFAEVRKLAIDAILSRHNTSGHRVLLRRLHLLSEDCRQIVKQRRSQMTRALRDAILETDEQTCANGCQAVLWFREYDLIPALINAVTDQGNPNAGKVGRTLLDLAESLYAEPTSPVENRLRRDPDIIFRHAVTILESAVGRFVQHRRREIIDSFLILADRDNVILRQILCDPHHPAFVFTIETLSRSEREGAINLLLSFLDDAHAPSAALSVLGNRQDGRFLHVLLQKICGDTSAVVEKNLKKIGSIGWLRKPAGVLDGLDDTDQGRLVKLATLCGVPRQSAFELTAYILKHGRAGGRRAAAEALGGFNGTQANSLVLACLHDDDPQVQASAIPWLRNRGIPGAFARLVGMLDSPHAVVREAAQANLSEYSVQRFLGTFDMLDEEERRSTGMLVKKVDSRTLPLLAAEMESPIRTHRLKALAAARVVEVIEKLEANVIALLDDDDHRVRVEAAAALSQASSPAVRDALLRALGDSSPSVQEAARESLEKLAPAGAIGAGQGGGS